jgi:hypothetical protein
VPAAGKLTAMVDWGDGQVSAADVAFDAGTHRLTVTGRRTYAKAGSFTVKTTITHHDGSRNFAPNFIVVLPDVSIGDDTVSDFGSAPPGPAELSLRWPVDDSS